MVAHEGQKLKCFAALNTEVENHLLSTYTRRKSKDQDSFAIAKII